MKAAFRVRMVEKVRMCGMEAPLGLSLWQMKEGDHVHIGGSAVFDGFDILQETSVHPMETFDKPRRMKSRPEFKKPLQNGLPFLRGPEMQDEIGQTDGIGRPLHRSRIDRIVGRQHALRVPIRYAGGGHAWVSCA